jgi:hypothetical protein
MAQSRRVAAQRQVVLEELKANSSPVIFELLGDILSIEREHRDHKHGVREAIKAAVERVAEHDLPEESA